MRLSQLLQDQGISLEASLNLISDGLIIVNAKAEILFVNMSAKEICGLKPEGHYTNWPNYVGVYEADKTTLYNPERLTLMRALRGERVVDEHLHLKNDLLKTWKCISCNASPIRSGEEIMGAILTFRDITERLKKEEEVRMERESYHKILDSIPAYIFTKDLDGSYTFINERFLKGFDAQFGQKPSSDFVSEEMKGHVKVRDQAVIASKKTQSFDEEYVNPNTNEKYYFETTRIPLFDHKNEVYGICGIAYDVTVERERKKQVEEERTKIATASKLAALGMLAAELGHEINNPLAIIRTSSWIMRKIISAENYNRDLALTKLDEIDNTVHRISEIVTSVKNLSRDSSREKMEDFILKDILRDVQSICGPKFHPKGIQFKLDEINPLINDKIFCYRVQLSEVLINLLVNAVDAVENVKNPWIRLEIESDQQNLIIRVDDNGPGVPEEIENKIISPFYSTKEVGKGTGLGLSISKEIMKRHNGDLVLNRKLSASCFEMILPKKKN